MPLECRKRTRKAVPTRTHSRVAAVNSSPTDPSRARHTLAVWQREDLLAELRDAAKTRTKRLLLNRFEETYLHLQRSFPGSPIAPNALSGAESVSSDPLTAAASEAELADALSAIDDILECAVRIDPLLDRHQDTMSTLHVDEAVYRLQACALDNELGALPGTRHQIALTHLRELARRFGEKGEGLFSLRYPWIEEVYDATREDSFTSPSTRSEMIAEIVRTLPDAPVGARFTVEQLITIFVEIDEGVTHAREQAARHIRSTFHEGFWEFIDLIPGVRDWRHGGIRDACSRQAAPIQRDASIYLSQAGAAQTETDQKVLARRAARRALEAAVFEKAGEMIWMP